MDTDKLQRVVDRVREANELRGAPLASDIKSLLEYVQADIDHALVAAADAGEAGGDVAVILLLAAGGYTLRLSVDEARALWGELHKLFGGHDTAQPPRFPLPPAPSGPWEIKPPGLGSGGVMPAVSGVIKW